MTTRLPNPTAVWAEPASSGAAISLSRLTIVRLDDTHFELRATGPASGSIAEIDPSRREILLDDTSGTVRFARVGSRALLY